MKSKKSNQFEHRYGFDYLGDIKKQLGKDFISIDEITKLFSCRFSDAQAEKMRRSYFSNLRGGLNEDTYVCPSSNCDLSMCDIGGLYPKDMTVDGYHVHNDFSSSDKIAGGEWFKFKKFDVLPSESLAECQSIFLSGKRKDIPNAAEFSYVVVVLSKLRDLEIPKGIYLTSSGLCDGGAVIAYIHKDDKGNRHLYFGDQWEFESSYKTFMIPEITKFPKVG